MTVERDLATWAGERGWPGDGWVREYARRRPDGIAGAVLGWAHPAGLAARIDVDPTGATRIAAAEEDPALPGLAAVLARLDRPRILRYRPGRRCTVRGDTDAGPRIVKVAPGGERHAADAAVLWAVRGVLRFAIAAPCGWDPDTGSAWYAVVPGRPVLDDLTGPDGPAAIRVVGTALASLAAAPVAPSARAGPGEQLARTRRAAARAAAAAPGLAEPLEGLVLALQRRQAALPPRPAVPVHGAPHQHQWLSDGGRLGLIDFDRFSRGDAELDLATLLAELADEPGRRASMGELTAAALAGYATGGHRLDEDRLRVYVAHKRLAKACRTACADRPDAEPRARRHLAAASGGLAARD